MSQKEEEAIKTAFRIIFDVYGTESSEWGHITLGRYFATCDLAELLDINPRRLYDEVLKEYKEASSQTPIVSLGQGEYTHNIEEEEI